MRNQFSELFMSKGVNYYDEDKPLVEMLKFFGFSFNRKLSDLGIYVSEELVELLDFIDHSAKPVLRTWSTLGKRIDYVQISPDHAKALLRLHDFGVISSILTGSRSLMHHFVSGYIISDSGIFCTLTLTAQTAYAIDKYADDNIRERFLPRFIADRDPWLGATFYTETQGGSDLGANVTSAMKEGEKYLLSGTDKYFASNSGLADAAIVTARVQGSNSGAKGISVFLVPALKEDGGQNYTIRRIKDKLGTVAVPTGEVEFQSTEGYLLGQSDRGIYIAMEILTISRIDDAIAALGIARKALWEAYRFAEKREAFGKRLVEHPLMIRDFVELESELEAALTLSLASAWRFDAVTGEFPPYNDRYQEARLLSSIGKNMASQVSAEVTRYCLEIMGGIGFLEEFPMAKFHRDSIVTSIWEGTCNIQALEFLEVLVRKDGMRLLIDDISHTISAIRDNNVSEKLYEALESARKCAVEMLEAEEPEFYAKEVARMFGELMGAVYLFRIAEQGGEASRLLGRSAEIYFTRHFSGGQLKEDQIRSAFETLKWMGVH